MLAISEITKENRTKQTDSKCKARNAPQSSDWKDWQRNSKGKKEKQIAAEEALQKKIRGEKDLIKLQNQWIMLPGNSEGPLIFFSHSIIT